MWKPLALVVACCAVVGSQIALASDGGNPNTTESSNPCSPAKKVYALKHWRKKHPARGKQVCPVAGREKLKERFHLFRTYRQVAPFRGYQGRGLWLRWLAIPRYIVDCESHGYWFAYNSSGASWLYQLLGWGAPRPDSARAKVRNHEIAHSVSSGSRNFSPWVCA